MTCRFCGAPLEPERVAELGYTHCRATPCVAQWRYEQTSLLRLDLVPKSGLYVSRRDDPSVARPFGHKHVA